MPFTPAYNALFAKPLLNQCIALIQRDQAAALAIVNGARTAAGNAALDPINEFHKGPGMRTAMPWLVLALNGLQFDRDAGIDTRHGTAHVSLELDVGQFDQEMAQDNAQDYARLLDMIVTTATTADWEKALAVSQETIPLGTTAPNAAGSVKECFVAAQSYGLVKLDDIPTPVLRVTLDLLFEIEEGRNTNVPF